MDNGEWFPLAAGWWCHPKVIGLSLPARGLWITARCYVGDQTTGGFVDRRTLALFGATEQDAEELADAGLFEGVEQGWLFHDFGDHEGKLEQKRAQWREQKARQRADMSAPVHPMSKDVHPMSTESPPKNKKRIKREVEIEPPTGDSLLSFQATWNEHCAPLPKLRKAPEGKEAERLVAQATSQFDGDLEAMGQAIERAAADSYYREHHHGWETFCRHVGRWGAMTPYIAANGSKPTTAQERMREQQSQVLRRAIRD